MKALKYLKSVSLVILSAGILTTSAVCLEKVSAQPAATTAKPAAVQQPAAQTVAATPLSIVDSPKTYLNKTVIMKAKFDKFSTLGLDYKPAFKSSDDYISFLIKRDDTTHDIPLSEMKLFLKRDLAEKFIDLKTDDEIEIKGKYSLMPSEMPGLTFQNSKLSRKHRKLRKINKAEICRKRTQ